MAINSDKLYGKQSISEQKNLIRRNNKKSKAATVITVGSVDYTILLTVSLLLLIGILMVFSAGYYQAVYIYEDQFYFLRRQITFCVMGFCVMMIMSSINYRFLMKFSIPLFLGSNLLLALVPFFGKEKGGQKRWIEIAGYEFQPSELSKLAIILLLSYLIYRNKNILKYWGGFLFCCILVGITSGLVLLGGLSTALIVAAIGFGIIFVASPHVTRFVVAAVFAVSGLVAYLVYFSQSYRGARFQVWLDPWSDPINMGFQIINSLYAIGSGGPFGLGIGQSRQKNGFLPEPHNDFIFSIICEELGFVGAALVLGLFAILIWRGISIAIKSPDIFASLFATGIVIMIGSQVVINVAVVTNSMPNTGIPMPFISYGGTSLLITMFLMGVLLSISRYSKEKNW